MFAFIVPGGVPARINLKCDPERAAIARVRHPRLTRIIKLHWNRLVLDGSLPSKLVKVIIDHSCDLVAVSLPKSLKI